MEVFEHVAESRNYSSGGTPLPISVSEVKSYFEMFYIESLVEREVLFRMIQEQDKVFLKVVTERAKKETDK